jgi:hypothetical protein
LRKRVGWLLPGYVAAAVMIGFVVVAAAGSARGLLILGLVFATLVVAGLFAVGALFLAVLVHEMGHIAAGLAVGFDFHSLSVGPFEVRRDRDRLRFGRAQRLRGVGGFVRMMPEGKANLERRLAYFIGGGPIASLIWAAAMYGVFRYTSHIGLQRGLGPFAVQTLGLCVFVMSVSLLPGTLVPFTSRSGNPTDMKFLLRLMKPSEVRGRLVAHFLLAREILGHVRARDWSPDLLESALRPADGTDEHVRVLLLLYYHHLDRGERAEALRWLAEAHPWAEKLKKGHVLREAVLMEAAYVAAWIEGDLAAGQALFERAGRENETLAGTRARVEAALALRQGDAATAAERADAAEAAIREASHKYGGDPGLDLDLIAEIRREIARVGSV